MINCKQGETALSIDQNRTEQRRSDLLAGRFVKYRKMIFQQQQIINNAITMCTLIASVANLINIYTQNEISYSECFSLHAGASRQTDKHYVYAID